MWRPRLLSDEDMRIHFHDLDGRWSRQTAEQMIRTGARGLDLNTNWALAEQGWSCPVCRRSKVDLFRVSANGVLLAKLDVHHDHLVDAIWSRSFELFGKDWIEQAPPGSGMRLDTIEVLIRRFRPTLVCSDCNAADGAAKNGIHGIDRRFSFAPDEIAAFSRVTPGSTHEVDVEKATEIWSTQKEKFEARLELIDRLIRLVHDGHLMESWSMGTFHLRDDRLNPSDALWAAFCRQYENDDRRQVLQNLREEFLSRSVSKDTPNLAKKSRRLAIAISDEEYAAYVDPVSQRRWIETPESWTCACCKRSKREIVRKSKSGKWSGGIRVAADYELETDEIEIQNRRALFPNLANRAFLRRVEETVLCSDCANVPVHLGHRFPDIGESHLNLVDIQDLLLSVTAHGPHEIDWDRGYARAMTNQPLVPARRAMDALRERAGVFQHWMAERRRYRMSEASIRERIHEELQYRHGVTDTAWQHRLTEWLLHHHVGRY